MFSALSTLLLATLPFAPEAQGRIVLERSPQSAPRTADRPATQQGGGWLGVTLRELEEEAGGGLEVSSVVEGSAAQRAGLRAGDRILSLNGRRAEGYAGFAADIQGRGAGTRVRIVIERGLPVELGRFGDDASRARLGVSLDGSSVGSVAEESAASAAEVRPGDRIVAVGDVACETAEDVIAAVRALEPGQRVSLRVRRDLPVVLGERPADTATSPPGAAPRRERARDAGANELFFGVPRAEPRDVERRSASIDALRSEVAELTRVLEDLRRQLDELRRELDRLR